MGEVTLNAGAARNTENESAVIVGGDVILAGETFVINGADQDTYQSIFATASAGITGGTGTSTMKITAKSVSVYGGNGKDGKDGDDGINGTGIQEAGSKGSSG